MLHTKNDNNWLCRLQKEVNNGRLLTHDGRQMMHKDRRRSIAIDFKNSYQNNYQVETNPFCLGNDSILTNRLSREISSLDNNGFRMALW